MRKIYAALTGVVLGLACTVTAQTDVLDSLGSTPPDSIVQLTAEAQGLELVAPTDLPRTGTFWLISSNGFMSPMPCPLASLPTYFMADGQYIIDGTYGQVAMNPRFSTNSTIAAILEAQANALVNLINQAQATQFEQGMMRMFATDTPTPGGDFGSGGGTDTNIYVTCNLDTNQLWLEITNVFNGWSYLNLHSGTNQFANGSVFAIWATTNLLSDWQVETELWPTSAQTNIVPFLVQNYGRENLFLRAEDWTSKDSNNDGIPDWWEWKYFGTLGLSATNDYDADGTNILQEYTNAIDPNKIQFTFGAANGFVYTNSPTVELNVSAGVPSYCAVLVDNAEFTNATWWPYTDSSFSVNLGTHDCPHEVWIGLRGLPADAQQTWEETTLSLDTSSLSISISHPAADVSFNSARVNVSGNFSAGALKQITVNGIRAFIDGTNYNALNIPLEAGTNTVTAIVENLAGLTNSTSISLTTTTNVDGSLNNPVQLQATPVAGFSPLPVTFELQTSLPGTIQQVAFDFNGDGLADFITNNLDAIVYTYTSNGEYFPIVTIQTTIGSFSSIGGWNAVALDATNLPVRINVQSPPSVSTFASITDPVDLKWMGTNLYVLSGSTATLTEYDISGNIIRSVDNVGIAPPSGPPTGNSASPAFSQSTASTSLSKVSGLDVDIAGNVYVAVTSSNQVWKYTPTEDSFVADTSFGSSGYIGNYDGSTGTNAGTFDSPFDVAISPDGLQFAVSDAGNHRIQIFDISGYFIGSFGIPGSSLGQFDTPKGLAYDSFGTLYIVDSGNNRIVMALNSTVVAVAGNNGTSLGQFSNPANISVGERGVYVADTGNDRIQKFDPMPSGVFSITPFNLGYAVSTNLNQPAAVAKMDDPLDDKFLVADTDNNRIRLYQMPRDNPLPPWISFTNQVATGDVAGALANFSSCATDKYRQAFIALGTNNLIAAIGQIGILTPDYIVNNQAEGYFTNSVDGEAITFPVQFIKENGVWKILEF